MIQEYSNFISSLIKAITGNDNSFSWSDFGMLMKNSVILVLFLLFLTFGLYFLLYVIPKQSYLKTIGKKEEQLKTLYENEEIDKYHECEKSIIKMRAFYITLIVVGYIPLLIPMLLMIINILF